MLIFRVNSSCTINKAIEEAEADMIVAEVIVAEAIEEGETIDIIQ